MRRSRRKLLCPDRRQRRAILRRVRAWWRHRPRGSLLLFFDVKPVTVKAYGGRCYTAGGRPVLPRGQKIRGRFYLFLVYEVNRGKCHWAFLPGKGAVWVCQFLRRVRRWYRGRPVRIALDRDPAHPCKSRRTRRLMRALGLHWISLPKRSPDDNAAEAIFSDIEQSVLESSNDAEPTVTQRRISAHLRARNRRPDRFIKIWYLPDIHKH